MGWLVRLLLPMQVLRPVIKPVTRLLIGALAIPLFRLFLRRVARMQELDRELEKDLEQWFRGSLLLLVATANMEHLLFDWVSHFSTLDLQDEHAWIAVGFRLLLAIGVIESMPDQSLFAIIHPGPPPIKFRRGAPCFGLKAQCWPYLKGMLCQHLNRSSPVLAIMAAIFGGNPTDGPTTPGQHTHWVVGWVCYGLAITQYLIIGLMTSKDKALDALSEFDRQVAIRRQELIEEFDVGEAAAAAVETSMTSPSALAPAAQKAG
jgi:hypothetical protein